MPSVRVAFVVHQPVDLTVVSPTPLPWYFVNCNQGQMVQGQRPTPLTAGGETLSLQPGLYGVMAPGNGQSKPALSFTFSNHEHAAAVMGNDKDPWPDPPPPPPKSFAAYPQAWANLWHVPAPSPLGATTGVAGNKPTTFLGVAGTGYRPTIRTDVFIW